MMKKCYQIIHTADQPDWAVAPRAQIDQLLWKPQTQITAYAQLVCGDDRLFVHLHADEDAIRAEETDPLAQPCQDSCLEFFLSALPEYRNEPELLPVFWHRYGPGRSGPTAAGGGRRCAGRPMYAQ